MGWFFFIGLLVIQKLKGKYVSLFKFICTEKILLYPKDQQNLNLLTKIFFSRSIIRFLQLWRLGMEYFCLFIYNKIIILPFDWKNESLGCGGVLVFIIGLLVIKRLKGSMLFFLSYLYSENIIVPYRSTKFKLVDQEFFLLFKNFQIVKIFFILKVRKYLSCWSRAFQFFHFLSYNKNMNLYLEKIKDQLCI